MCYAGEKKSTECWPPDIAFRNKKLHSVHRPESVVSKCSNILPTRRSKRNVGNFPKVCLIGGKRDEPFGSKVGLECSNVLPTRRSERIRKRKLCHCKDQLCAGIEKEGSLLPRTQESRTKKQKVNSPSPGDESQGLLPIELITEILSFLSVKCLSRFKCVSKSWRAAIEEHYFIMKHYSQAKCVHLYDRQGGEALYRTNETFVALYSIAGLLLERTDSFRKYRVRNPATKQVLDLPDPHEIYLHMMPMYLSNSKKYKLAYFYSNSAKKFGGCKILTMEKVLKWRTLEVPNSLRNMDSVNLGRNCTVAVGDMIFVYNRAISEIACIDMESERFSSIKIPQLQDFISDSENIRLQRWNNQLSVTKLEHTNSGWKLSAWIMEDFKKQKWAEKLIVVPLNFMVQYPNTMDRDILLQSVHMDWLSLVVQKKHRVVYHVKSNRVSVTSAPAGHGYSIYYFPSLMHFDGMKQEEK